MKEFRTRTPELLSLAESFHDSEKYAAFAAAYLGNKNFSGMWSPSDAVFVGADFSGANFTKARLNCVAFVKCNLTNAVFANASVWDAQFSSCNMQGVVFDNTNAKGTLWNRCDLRGCVGLSPDGLQPGEIGSTHDFDLEWGSKPKPVGAEQPSIVSGCVFDADTEFGRWQTIGKQISEDCHITWRSGTRGDFGCPHVKVELSWQTQKFVFSAEFSTEQGMFHRQRLGTMFGPNPVMLGVTRSSRDEEIVTAVQKALGGKFK